MSTYQTGIECTDASQVALELESDRVTQMHEANVALYHSVLPRQFSRSSKYCIAARTRIHYPQFPEIIPSSWSPDELICRTVHTLQTKHRCEKYSYLLEPAPTEYHQNRVCPDRLRACTMLHIIHDLQHTDSPLRSISSILQLSSSFEPFSIE